ncbi:hypothetical protein HX091_15880 [Myroides odoratimimus]|uniref:hypothetical protein n=1 Tax=Myroides odoratimimus TaxID=76832 RepID=UPI00257668AE|nr:hypothetical protein [Myroides odoratimimus]MDM1527396.1 hypothetical protein [Myroides odoratimimus]
MKAKSISGNSSFFLELGYFINTMTLNKDFITNDLIINNIISSSTIYQGTNLWRILEISDKSVNHNLKGKEFMLFEGYLMRYISQYLYINKESNVIDKKIAIKTFFKWYYRSVEMYGDASLLFGSRLHMASHWATIAVYSLDIANEKEKVVLEDFIKEFDLQVRDNLKTVYVNEHECYIWNSTYYSQFTKLLKERKKDIKLQDVSHGNHIIQYVLDCYELGLKSWLIDDLRVFRNTLKYIIWQNPNRAKDFLYYSDNRELGTGWKQSDGWMKLMIVLKDNELYDIYNSFYKNNSIKIDKNYPNIQFYINMVKFRENSKL